MSTRAGARSRSLLAAVREMERRRDGAVPWSPEAAAVFADPDDLVLATHARWHRILAVRLDPLLERGCSETGVLEAWRDWAAATPGQRAVLERALSDCSPAMRTASLRQDAQLAAAAGLVPAGVRDTLAAGAWRAALSSYLVATGTPPRRRPAPRWTDRLPCRIRQAA